jgi:hypothetical protein
MVRGIRAEDLLKKEALAKAVSGVDLKFFRDDGVIMGIRLARKMGLSEGVKITLLSPNGKVTAFGTVRQWPEIWEESRYVASQINDDKVISAIENYVYTLKSES